VAAVPAADAISIASALFLASNGRCAARAAKSPAIARAHAVARRIQLLAAQQLATSGHPCRVEARSARLGDEAPIATACRRPVDLAASKVVDELTRLPSALASPAARAMLREHRSALERVEQRAGARSKPRRRRRPMEAHRSSTRAQSGAADIGI
jgi:hypothetical protein